MKACRLVLALVGCFSVATILAGCGGGDVDRRFDVSVADPAFRKDGPRVLYDEAHHPHHKARRTYAPFVRLLENDGFRVSVNRRAFDADVLGAADILAIVTAAGTNDVNDEPAFTPQECDALRDWVERGGALLLVFDHFPYGDAAQELARRFGADLGRGSVEDEGPELHDPASTGQLVFSRANGLLADHPITRGRSADEAVTRVMTFDGASIGLPAGATALLSLSDTAVDLAPQVKVARSGGDVRVEVTFAEPMPATGRAQGIALEVGKGRVVILGEAAMLTAQLRDGVPSGMNVPGIDNRQFALNVARWLARVV